MRENGVIRGFVTGLVWGGIVAGAGLAVISQVVPVPKPAMPPVVADATPEQVDGAVVEAPETPKPAATPTATPEAAPQATPESASEPASEAVAPLGVTAVDPDPLATPDTPNAAPQGPTADSGDLPRIVAVPSVPSVTPLAPDAAPAAAEPPPAMAQEPAEAMAEPLLEKAPDMPVPSAVSDAPDTLVPDLAPTLPQAPRLIVPDGKPLTDQQDAPAEDALPRIGDAPEMAAPVPVMATPLDLFSRPFDNLDAKPLFALVLVDDGAPATDRETLAALPFPVTFVVDPLAADAASISAIYRNAGQEVMMLTTGIPKGATAADIEQSYQAMDIALPEAVAVLGAAGLNDDSRDLAAAVVPILAAQGRGIVTLERGLNAVDQAARREGLPQATVFRMLDGSGESVPVIRRYLDRAAFRAAQQGSVVVLGSTRPDTVAAILQWTVEGRAASVAMAPISAVLRAGP